MTVGETLIGAATGSVAALFATSRKDRRSGAYMWVPAQHRDRWADYQNDEEPGPEEQQPADEGIHFSGSDVDTTCTFGEETFVPSAPLERRGLYGVELTRTVDHPAPQRSLPPHGENSPAAPQQLRQPSHRVDAPTAPRQALIPSQPSAPAVETQVPASAPAAELSCAPTTRNDAQPHGLPASLIALQQTANLERIKLECLDSPDERAQQRRIWLEAATAIQHAVTHYATAENLNRFDVEQQLRRAVKTDDIG